MKKRFLKLGMALALLCVLLLAIGSAGAEAARDVTSACTLTVEGAKQKSIALATDRDYTTYLQVRKGGHVTVDRGTKPLSGLFLQYYDRATEVLVEARVNGVWQDIATGGVYLSEWIALPEGTTAARVHNRSNARLFLAELTACGEGDTPDWAAVWQVCEKADLMLFSCHPDDELLWFGGLLPTYAGERGLQVQVVYTVPSTPVRRLELLDGLWHCGVHNYPAFLGMRDAATTSLKAQYTRWNKTRLSEKVVEMLRRYRPEVVVTHDLEGEYGHGGHRATADAVTGALALAAEAKQFPASAKEYGAWQVKKCYVHLYPENQVQFDWHIPLAAFGGRDGWTVACEAFACHKSQVKHGWAMKEGGECDSTLFGLYYTTVGPDETADLMEHINREDVLAAGQGAAP